MTRTNLNRLSGSIVITLVLLLPLTSWSQQQLSTTSKKAVRFYKVGRQAYMLYDFVEAEYNFNEAIKTDENFLEAYMVLAEVYWDQSKYEKSIATYNKALAIDPVFYPRAFLNKGRLELKVGRYSDAHESLNRFLTIEKRNQKDIEKARAILDRTEYALRAIENPVDFEPVNLGASINTKDDEYWPSLSADNRTLVFTRLLGSANGDRNIQEDFFVSELIDDKWLEAKNMGKPLNTYGNEGAQSISADGKTMVYTVCNQPGVIGRCDLYISYKRGENWTTPRNMGKPINTPAKETQPALSADGRIIYFSSDRPGGKGGLDLWRSFRNPDNSWSAPENLGDSINTKGNEVSPFIHFDNRTLYFSSDFKMGMGEHDIFIATLNNNDQWSPARNIGYPINTHRDEIGMIVNAKGNIAYYSSDIDKANGKDIFQFKLYEAVRPQEVSYLKGVVYDKESLRKIKADFELHDIDEGKLISKSSSDPKTGEFLLCIPTNRNYLLNVNKQGYLFYSDHFALKGIFKIEEPFLKDVPLSPVKSGESVILKNIFYATDSFALEQSSQYELNRIVQFMEENITVKIQISGHTDDVGSENYNLQLSEKRANSVIRYLIDQGINKDRLESIGYGMSKPVDTNETEEGRANNRRTEMLIIE